MADDLENSGQWRDTVNTRLSTLEAKVKQEARLRAAMDEDLSHLHVERDLLQALHDTQSEHTAQIRGLREGVDGLQEGLGAVKETLQEVRVGVNLINGKLDRLIADDNTASS